jgi:hypothetical protein
VVGRTYSVGHHSACQSRNRVRPWALRVATRTRTALSLQQVYDVRRQLERWHDSRAVRELDEQLRLAG